MTNMYYGQVCLCMRRGKRDDREAAIPSNSTLSDRIEWIFTTCSYNTFVEGLCVQLKFARASRNPYVYVAFKQVACLPTFAGYQNKQAKTSPFQSKTKFGLFMIKDLSWLCQTHGENQEKRRNQHIISCPPQVPTKWVKQVEVQNWPGVQKIGTVLRALAASC